MGKILGEERTARSERTSKLPSRSLRRYDPYQVRRVVWNHAVQNSQPIKDTPAYASSIAFQNFPVNTHRVCPANPFWIQLISAISVCDDTGVGYHGLKVVNLIDNVIIEVK